MFKDFWTNFDDFWEEVLKAFDIYVSASLIALFYDCLKQLKMAIRGKDWSSSKFISSIMPKGAKATAITLIPKGTHSNSISNFRPISLCNVFYKIMAKIMANRMKPILPFIIHESQLGFISKRCSTDNIILTSEVLREFKDMHKYFCAKLDIKKALILFLALSFLTD